MDDVEVASVSLFNMHVTNVSVTSLQELRVRVPSTLTGGMGIFSADGSKMAKLNFFILLFLCIRDGIKVLGSDWS